MSKAASFASSLLLFVACSTMPANVRQERQIERAMATNDCRLVDDVYMFVPPSGPAREFVDACWDTRQKEIIPAAMQRRDCEATLELPGYYPFGQEDAWQRFVYHCWVKLTERHLDSCIGLIQVGDESSIPYLIKALKETPPVQSDDGTWNLVDTAGACLDAWQRIENLSAEQLRARASELSPRWKAWAAKQ